MGLTVKTTEHRVGVFTIAPAGPIDSNTYPALEKQLDLILNSSPQAIVFDLSGVDFISSMGVGVILKAKKHLGKTGGEFRMVNLQPPVKKVFEIIAALPPQEIFQSVEEMDRYLAEMQKEVKS